MEVIMQLLHHEATIFDQNLCSLCPTNLIYDKLISEIPSDLTIDEFIIGGHFSMVRCKEKIGLARTIVDDRLPRLLIPEIGMPLSDFAAAIQSWNFTESSLALAAINCYYTTNDLTTQNKIGHPMQLLHHKLRSIVREKRVALIGENPLIEQLLKAICDLSVFGDEQIDTHYPMAATEFLLKDMDYICSGDTSITSKTLPRLLQLTNATMILLGFGIPISPILHNFGIQHIMCYVVSDPELCRKLVLSASPETNMLEACSLIHLENKEFHAM